MTEDEAKKKECWQWLYHDKGGVIKPHCTGSTCMAWVWDDETHLKPEDRTAGGHCGIVVR